MFNKEIICLGLESSCDETAAAIVKYNFDKKIEILSNIIHSQINIHKPYGGVVPELAARSHIEYFDKVVKKSLDKAKINYKQLDLISVTSGPGLLGGLIVGLMSAKAISLAHDLPFITVNHLEGHALTVKISNKIDPPYLLLLISGGHTQILQINAVGDYKLLGNTLDDALGETFDKVAKLLNLGYPGGPSVEFYAKQGNKNRFKLPRPMKGRKNCNFSFSGLKTSVLYTAKSIEPISKQDKKDICASFQDAIVDCLIDRIKYAIFLYHKSYAIKNNKIYNLVIAGGVASNKYIALKLSEFSKKYNFKLTVPPGHLCTDNGAMIAWVGITKYIKGDLSNLKSPPKSRWSLCK